MASTVTTLTSSLPSMPKMPIKTRGFSLVPTLLALTGLAAPAAQAATFGLPRYVAPDASSLGLETELNLDHGAGWALNGKFDHGISELTHVGALIGTGGGHRQFRIGGQAGFDIYPDDAGQVGLGVGTQMIYYRLREDTGQLELTAVPYLHKTFGDGAKEYDPFLSVPWGFAFASGHTDLIASLSVGSTFKLSDRLRWIAEFTIAIQHTDSMISGGVIYGFP